MALSLLPKPARLWEDYAEIGFWSWQRHDDTVLMSAELELAAGARAIRLATIQASGPNVDEVRLRRIR